jgi:uncharacterized protein (TIGR02996 family)
VTLTTTIAAILRAVREQPDDDLPRLALADVLAETDPDEGGDADWAEFIRVGVELARTPAVWPEGKWVGFIKRNDLACRSDALRAAHEARWRRGPACGRCGGKGKGKIRVRLSSNRHWTRTDPTRRRQNHASCPDCRGSGWTGPLGRHGFTDRGRAGSSPLKWVHSADFRRGFIHRVSTPLADVFAGNDVTDWAVRVARWPQVCLEEWGLTDRKPWQHPDGKWFLPTIDMPTGVLSTPGYHWSHFDTPDAARLALARSVAQVVNEAAHD